MVDSNPEGDGFGYDIPIQHNHIIDLANGATSRISIGETDVQFQLAWPRKSFSGYYGVSPNLGLQIERGRSKLTPMLGCIFFLGDIKWNLQASLAQNEWQLKQRAEYLTFVRGHRVQLGLLHTLDLMHFRPTFYRSLLSITRGKFEGSIVSGRDGSHFPNLDFVNLGLVYQDPRATAGVELSFKPKDWKKPEEITFGASKNFGTNMKFKSKYELISGVSAYAVHFIASPQLQVNASLQVATKSVQGVFKGLGQYPLNFGLELKYEHE